MTAWSVHFCPLDPDCCIAGTPWRLTLNTPWGDLLVAFRWGDRFQLWLPWKTRGLLGGRSNYSRWFTPIAWHPRRNA
jgi:hypothetical protein